MARFRLTTDGPGRDADDPLERAGERRLGATAVAIRKLGGGHEAERASRGLRPRAVGRLDGDQPGQDAGQVVGHRMVEPITTEAFTEALARGGVREDVISLLRCIFEVVLVDADAEPANGVQRALGRAPPSFAAFARDAYAAGAWRHAAAA